MTATPPRLLRIVGSPPAEIPPSRTELRDTATIALVKIAAIADAMVASIAAENEGLHRLSANTLTDLADLVHTLAGEGIVAACDLKGLDDAAGAADFAGGA